MRTAPKIESAGSVVVGNYYSVPHVATNKDVFHRKPGTLIPIIGPEHEDAEFINFPFDHWHIDWRFVNRSLFKQRGNGWVVLGTPINVSNTTNEIIHKVRKCLREMPVFPPARVPWRPKLEAAYAGCKLKPGMVCPHRGIPLNGCPVKDGVVVCPGHGLRWNVETGELLRSI